MTQNMLTNGDFEADWGQAGSHRCFVFPDDAVPYQADIGNIFTPPGWLTWFRHKPGDWDQPEVRDAWIAGDPRRVHQGQKGMLLFTFYRKHDAGFLQPVRVAAGEQVRLSGWAHAWSNCQGRPHTDDPYWSEGPGYAAGYMLEGEQPPPGTPGGLSDWRNFTFYLGLDPAGNTDPYGNTVVWGRGAHIYNEFGQVPAVEATAQGEIVTVFLRSRTLWPFKHNDAYWDSVSLVASEAPSVALGMEPAEPVAGATVTVRATSSISYTAVALEVTDPDGEPVVQSGPESGQVNGMMQWEWRFVPREAGAYQVDFRAENGAPVHAASTVVVAEPGAGSARLDFEALEPKSGDRVGVIASSVLELPAITLAITGPSGAEVPSTEIDSETLAGQYVWRWEFLAAGAGAYDAVLTTDGGLVTLAHRTVDVRRQTDAGCVPPRVAYPRTYVLLPQDAGPEWVEAILESGRWTQHRWTIGSSADDAGVGPEQRTVIAVNPDRWPGDLEAFFGQYYPGLRYVVLEAATPDDLAASLRRLSL
jgi:hypothetical protein